MTDACPTAGERLSIAVLSPLLAETFFGGVMGGITREAKAVGVSVVGIQTRDARGQDVAPEFRRPVAWDQFAGAIVLLDAVDLPYLEALRRAGRHVVMVANEVEGFACPSVSSDNASGVASAVAHLVEHGHRRIAFAGWLEQPDIRERYAAYRDALREHGITPDDDLLVELTDNVETGGEEAARALLAAGMPATATVAGTDYNAIGMLRILGEAGYELPRDHAVVGFDDAEAAASAVPALSSVRQDYGAIGRIAVRSLLAQVRDGTRPAVHDRVPTSLVVRESCGCGSPSLSRAGSPPAGLRRTRQVGLDECVALPEKPDRCADRVQVESRLTALLERADVADGVLEPTGRLVSRLVAAVEEPGMLETADLAALADAVVAHAGRWDRVVEVVDCLRAYSSGLAVVRPEREAERERFAADLALALARAHMRGEIVTRQRLQTSLRNEYRLSLDLLRSDDEAPRELGFVARTPMQAACLGLWREVDRVDCLEVTSTFTRDGSHPVACGVPVPMSQFPPRALLDLADGAAGDVTIVLPVKGDATDWGMLALVGPIEGAVVTGRDFYFQCAALLGAALDHEALLDSLRCRQEELRRSEERYSLAASAANDGLWDWDIGSGEIYVSDRMREMLDATGVAPVSQIEEWLRLVHPEDLEALSAAVGTCLGGHSDVFECEMRLATGDGSHRWVLCRGRAVPGAPSPATRLVGSLTDVTVNRQLAERLRHQALHDALTGLPNRTLVLERAAELLATARRHGDRVGALFIDLDDFKQVNDSLGHASGDELLVSVAERLRSAVREADIVGRLGGDEFVVLVDESVLVQGAALVAERVRALLRAPFLLCGREYLLSASIGIATSQTGTADELLRDADTAMYRAKAAGKNCHVSFEPEMQLVAHDRLELEMDLASALHRDELRVFYQPIVRLSDMVVSGMEALVRWQHPTRGLLEPAEFVPVAEANGHLIVDIGSFVLREACAAAADWRRRGFEITVAVNVSPRQLESVELVEEVRATLAESGLPAGQLVLEVTETAIMHDAEAAVARLGELKAVGVLVAIDDFGTGYSSLAYLRQFPVDVLKIDRSFIASVPESVGAHAVVQTLVSLGTTLGLEVVAEGVEIPGQLDAVRDAGCQTAQGYFFARPLDAPGLARFLLDGVLPGVSAAAK